jgi:hypothetical protein
MARSKGKGGKASSVGNFIASSEITNISVTDKGSEGRADNDGKVTISWTPASGVRNTPTGYKVYVDGVLKATVAYGTNTADVTGLATGSSHNISVVPYDAYIDQASTTGSTTATAVPKTMTAPTATDVGSARAYNNGRADVAFTAPSDNGSAILDYTVTSSPGGYTATGTTSPISVTGLQSSTAYTFTIKARNANGSSIASSASNSITATTVPATPGAPSASSPNANQDVISWSAPADGGSAITNYHWTSSDGKSGDTGTGTSATVAQEAGTAQTYNVYATNVNGNSGISSNSGSVTTTFSFAPFGVFGFSPFGVFGFSPFGVFGFSPFGVFGFSPFGVFGFSPYGFATTSYGVRCIDGETYIRITQGQGTESVDSETGKKTLRDSQGNLIAKQAKDIQVGDRVLSIEYAEIDPSSPDYEVFSWSSDSLTFTDYQDTTIVDIEESSKVQMVCFNNDESAQFTLEHPILVKKTVDGVSTHRFAMVAEIEPGDSIFKYNPSTGSQEEVVVESLDIIAGEKTTYIFSAEPVDLIIAGDIITHNK